MSLDDVRTYLSSDDGERDMDTMTGDLLKLGGIAIMPVSPSAGVICVAGGFYSDYKAEEKWSQHDEDTGGVYRSLPGVKQYHDAWERYASR